MTLLCRGEGRPAGPLLFNSSFVWTWITDTEYARRWASGLEDGGVKRGVYGGIHAMYSDLGVEYPEHHSYLEHSRLDRRWYHIIKQSYSTTASPSKNEIPTPQPSDPPDPQTGLTSHSNQRTEQTRHWGRRRRNIQALSLLLAARVVLREMQLLLDLLEVDVRHGVLAVEDAGDLLEGRATGLDVEEVHEDGLAGVPEGVEEHEVPVVGEVLPRELVGLAVVVMLANRVTSMVTGRGGETYFPRARMAWTVMFMIIIPLARRWKGRTSRA